MRLIYTCLLSLFIVGCDTKELSDVDYLSICNNAILNVPTPAGRPPKLLVPYGPKENGVVLLDQSGSLVERTYLSGEVDLSDGYVWSTGCSMKIKNNKEVLEQAVAVQGPLVGMFVRVEKIGSGAWNVTQAQFKPGL